MKPSQRLVFLDVVRGLTIAFMILVNNNGSERLAYWPLKHADWR
jgi:predicted acyltransferase